MTPSPELDRLDWRILQILQGQGKLSNKDLAEQVGLSASACLARVKRLETAGIITGYRAEIAPERLPATLTLYAEITLSQHRPEDFATLDRLFASLPEVVEAAQIAGAADYVIKVVVQDMEHWRRLNDLMLDRGRIEDVKTSVVMKQSKRFAGVPLTGA